MNKYDADHVMTAIRAQQAALLKAVEQLNECTQMIVMLEARITRLEPIRRRAPIKVLQAATMAPGKLIGAARLIAGVLIGLPRRILDRSADSNKTRTFKNKSTQHREHPEKAAEP